MAGSNFKASSIIKNPNVIDLYREPLLFIYEWSVANDGADTAEATMILAKKGWIPIVQSASPGGGFGGKQIVIFTTFRKVTSDKPKRSTE